MASFRLFRPLVYFAPFGSQSIFDCLELAVSSLVTHGGWRWDVLVITAAETVETVRTQLQPTGLGDRLHVASIEPCDTLLDFCLARFRLDAHPVMARAQPLLYLDVDIICDRPLDRLLATLASSPMVHACIEGALDEGSTETSGHWYGWRLMAEDGLPFDPKAKGFSSGALGVANSNVASEAYSLILRSTRADAGQADGGRRLAGLDQPFANYVLHRIGGFETVLLSRYLDLYRIQPGGPAFPPTAQARGLVHFLNANTAGKLASMRSYDTALSEIAARSNGSDEPRQESGSGASSLP